MRFLGLGLLAAIVGIGMINSAVADDAADATFFETRVRPLLHAKCIECHGSDKPKAGLSLTSREEILQGGESGPAAISGKPEESLLVDVIGYRNVVQMPPKSKLPDSDILILTDWIRRGLPWPNSKPATPAPAAATITEFTDEQKAFWAFQPVQRVSPPAVQNHAWVRSPIDHFLLAERESKGLPTSPEASKRTLVRRLTIDLIGLLPTPHEVADFVSDESPDALERLVDRLLASPHYGERWGRRWLDVARYADSNGMDENLAYANAYRYRDYVVKSMREDKPYDRFLTEQIAGDLLPSPYANSTEAHLPPEAFDGLIATGFLCLGPKMLAEDDPVKMQMDIIDEQVDTIARAVMGLTMGCARCHDHKFDPLSTEDYYGLAGVFKSTQTMDTFTVVARWHERPMASPLELQQRDSLEQLAKVQKETVEKLVRDSTAAAIESARKQSGSYLLAATRETQLAELLSTAKPRGVEPHPQQIPGAIFREAEDFDRGNVIKDKETYGKEIGVLVNRGETPNFVEYDINVETAGTYQFELRYAAVTERTVKTYVNQRLVKKNAASKVTGSWTPDSQTWFVECYVTLNAGKNLIRLEQPNFFPHIDKLLLTPVAPEQLKSPAFLPDVSEGGRETFEPLGTLTQQWAEAIRVAKADPQSILTAWNQFVTTGQLTVDPSAPENGIARLLGESQPTSLADLAQRYDQLFEATRAAWIDLQKRETATESKSLEDPVLNAAHQLLTNPEGPFRTPPDIEAAFSAETQEKLKMERAELAGREAAIPKFPEVMAVVDSTPENLKIHLRGSHLTLGRQVPRQLPKILTDSMARLGIATHELQEGSGRLELAQWLTSPQHPLTSRVMTNRIWQWHFGQGLVRSPDNFGRLGERPSHPELLDWLASEFSGAYPSGQDSPRNWSLKAFHRALTATSTYRQNTDYDAAAALADPDNKLLWRFHRQRMDVEVLRDSLLALSGQLDERQGGTLLTTPNRNYVTSTANVNPALYNSNRRSIYLPVVRSALYEVFTAFDFADPSTLAGQRDQTTVAPQALFMMNSAFVLDQVQPLAQQLLAHSELDHAARTKELYQRAYGRDPSETEVTRAASYLQRLRASLAEAGVSESETETRAWVSLCRAVLSANEFVYVE